jgi:hypothetical protein
MLFDLSPGKDVERPIYGSKKWTSAEARRFSQGVTQRPPRADFESAWQVPTVAVVHLEGQLGMRQSSSNHAFATFDSCSIAKGSLGSMNTRHSQPGAAATRSVHCDSGPGVHESCGSSSFA